MHFFSVYKSLHGSYGPQNWWPADTPFEVMVGAILTQNTAWTNVEKAITNLKKADRLDAEAIIKASSKRLATWIRPAGYFNVKAKRLQNYCHWYLGQGGFDPLNKLETHKLRQGLLSVNGVGHETADDILLYAFERPVFIIDAYTRRIFSRLGLVNDQASYEELRRQFESSLAQKYNDDIVKLYNEYHALIVNHGKNVCKKSPLCENCCLQTQCPAAVS